MEQLAKAGILLTNIGLGVGALIFIILMTGLFNVFGFILAVVISIASGTLWFMLVSAYNKFMAIK